jgi:protein-tyrosine phosphatase
MERNFNITGAMVGVLIQNGALIQVNAFSFQDDADEEYQKRAKELLSNRYIHFIGSDAHRINHRPPKIQQGIQYILDNTDNGYALQILNGNAESLFGVVLPQIGNLHND